MRLTEERLLEILRSKPKSNGVWAWNPEEMKWERTDVTYTVSGAVPIGGGWWITTPTSGNT
jgi:hypothetical protein